MNGLIFDIKRFAVHDGPGIRATVFFKGCPLSCWWCHNPESICAESCTVPKQVKIGDKVFVENETVGRQISTEALMNEIRKEKVFMDESGGGVTFSGGEPLMQPAFLLEMLQKCNAEGIHTAVDTSGFSGWTVFEQILPFTDLFLFDVKIINENEHLKYTGVSNRTILNNLKLLTAKNKTIRVRIPMIPDVTWTKKNIDEILAFLHQLNGNIEAVDLLPYHNTAAHKYERFGLKNTFAHVSNVNKNELENVKQQFEKKGFVVKIGG